MRKRLQRAATGAPIFTMNPVAYKINGFDIFQTLFVQATGLIMKSTATKATVMETKAIGRPEQNAKTKEQILPP